MENYDQILQSLQDMRTYSEQFENDKEIAYLEFLKQLDEYQQVDNQAINIFSAYKDSERENKELTQANRHTMKEMKSLESKCKRFEENGTNIITSTIHKLSMINNEMDNYCNLQDNLSKVHNPDNIRKQTILNRAKIEEKKKTLSSFGTYKDALSLNSESSIPNFDKVLMFNETSNRKKHSNIIQNYYKLRDKLNSVE
ncbi:PREDICTED: uncharacterized protein LOC108562922 [Nicrophorus vespilloides]|uniref:Uncharacterized protein LOC108562922 n=1 Tax=Nicrophorus vespilloides TaxID=110193 RepID=A0ABM1MQR9_NICVS|nr:PREDICTED: uncharacterized protein LOC108562922 [Nicrophorus vespilloides]XP_017776927.1 PREDICTED: uncharacterized protein LOC108562922 [Nicrophorus vespilloides]